MSLKSLFVVLALAPFAALAQSGTEFSSPPLVPAPPPPPMPAAEPSPALQPGTPPPPAPAPPPSYVPGAQPQSGYQYSPYGAPPREKPGPEVGLMVSESLFGMLTAAGVTILPYFLLFGSGQLLPDPTISSVIFILIFSAVPLAVAQTQVSLANGSRFYFSETWPAALAGLGAEAAVLGIFSATGWLPKPQVSTGLPATGGSVVFLLVSSIAIVPLIQMAVVNLAKQPKVRSYALNFNPHDGVELGLPLPSPTVAQTRGGLAYGVNFPLINMTF